MDKGIRQKWGCQSPSRKPLLADKNIYSRGIKKRNILGGKEFIPDFTIYHSKRIFIYRKLTNNIYLMEKFKGKYLFMVLAKNLINSFDENDCIRSGISDRTKYIFPTAMCLNN